MIYSDLISNPTLLITLSSFSSFMEMRWRCHAVFEMTHLDKSGNKILEEISSHVFEREGKKYVQGYKGT